MTSLLPFIKWPGGKRKVLPEISKYVPEKYGTYFEPFLGGGAVLFGLTPDRVNVSDINPELINTYLVVKNNPKELIKILEKHNTLNTQEYYYQIRELDRIENFNSVYSPEERAARFIYLNKTCFNGLYRQNQSGFFNSPWGYYDSPKILDAVTLKNVSQYLNKAQAVITNEGYVESLINVGVNDFVYLDPPYVPLTDTSNFVQYSKTGFPLAEHKNLAKVAKELDDRKALVLISNSDTPLVRELYKDFVIKPIQVTRSISASSLSRKKVGEVLILGKTLASNLNIEES